MYTDVYWCVLLCSDVYWCVLMIYWRIVTASGVLKCTVHCVLIVYWYLLTASVLMVYWLIPCICILMVYRCVLMCTDGILTYTDCFRCTEGILKCNVHCVLIVYWCVLTASVLMVYWRILTASGVLRVCGNVLFIAYWLYTDVYWQQVYWWYTDLFGLTDCLGVYWGFTEVYCLLVYWLHIQGCILCPVVRRWVKFNPGLGETLNINHNSFI